MDKEFMEKCLQQRNVVLPVTVTKIEDSKTMFRLAEQHNNNSEYTKKKITPYEMKWSAETPPLWSHFYLVS